MIGGGVEDDVVVECFDLANVVVVWVGGFCDRGVLAEDTHG